MPTYGKDTCPFTGEKFARVREGRGGTVLVTTPVLCDEVALQPELYEDLARHSERVRLRFRRWVADAIDAGTLPVLLTGEHLVNAHDYPPPSLGVKADRLLRWMVMERKAKYGIEKEFDFGDDRVGARHEACLITETSQRDHLIPFIEALRDKGYVEYPGSPGQIVSSLVIRLTPAGFENAGRPPMVHQASVHSSPANSATASGARPQSEQASFPPGATARQIEKIILRTVDRNVMRENLARNGSGLVDLTDVLIHQLDAVLDPQHFGDNRAPIGGDETHDLRPEFETLRDTLSKFREALASAVASPVEKATKPVLSRGAKVLATLRAIDGIRIVQAPILATEALGFYYVLHALGVSVDLATVVGTVLGR